MLSWRRTAREEKGQTLTERICRPDSFLPRNRMPAAPAEGLVQEKDRMNDSVMLSEGHQAYRRGRRDGWTDRERQDSRGVKRGRASRKARGAKVMVSMGGNTQNQAKTITILLSAYYAQAFCKPSAYITDATGIY